MVGLEGHVYAQILNNRVHWVFTTEQLPEWNETDITVLDITELSPQPQSGWQYVDGIFISPYEASAEEIFAKLKQKKIEDIKKACKEAITNGYLSAALGDIYLYPSKALDQTNMVASVTDSLNPANGDDWFTPFWCADSSQVWEYRLHTKAQIQRAGADGKAHIVTQLSKNAQLQAQIQTATTEEELNAIVW